MVVVVVDFYYAGGARAWTWQALWYMPCGDAVCDVCCDFATCMYASLALFAKKPLDIHAMYVCHKRAAKSLLK